MTISDRQKLILDHIRTGGVVSVDALSDQFGLSTQTIRRDLNALCAGGYARRVHGGARAVDSMQVANLAYGDRRTINAAGKRDIARRAAALIPDGCSLMLNIGTTTEMVAKALSGHRDLVVVSNNLNIITELSRAAPRDLIAIGGQVRLADGAVIGAQAAEHVGRYKADYAVIGCSAIDDDGAVLDFDASEVSVSRAMLRNARARILVVDQSKFTRTAPVRVCTLDEIDHVVTDRMPSDGFMAAADSGGAEVIVTASAGLEQEV